jgi:hypothetical protein
MIATIVYVVNACTKTMIIEGHNISINILENGQGIVEISDENRNILRALVFGQLEVADVDRTAKIMREGSTR